LTFTKETDHSRTEAYLALLERHKGILYKVARTYATEIEKDDLVQEICLQLWKSFDQYNDQYAESTWVYRIALNTCISAYRKGRRQAVDAVEMIPILYTSDEAEEDRLNELYRLIQALKEIDRAILLLYLEGKSNKEMAAIMGYTETNVSTRLSRIRNDLKSMINKLNN